jgi:hypothetical protein
MFKINIHNNSYWLDLVLFIESRYDFTRMYHTVLITMFKKQVKTQGISLYTIFSLSQLLLSFSSQFQASTTCNFG